jgi:uncharacterized membrane protein (UPF0127 family)
MDIQLADSPLKRLRGLLGHREPPPFALRLEPCRSIHTFGMRFALDLHWLDADDVTIRVDRAVPPGRIRFCRGAVAIVEVPCPRPAQLRTR